MQLPVPGELSLLEATGAGEVNPRGLEESIYLTISLLAAMPAISSIVIMARASGSEGDYAMGGLFVTTVCSIITIPVTCWLIHLLG